jgi:hypothetical protein
MGWTGLGWDRRVVLGVLLAAGACTRGNPMFGQDGASSGDSTAQTDGTSDPTGDSASTSSASFTTTTTSSTTSSTSFTTTGDDPTDGTAGETETETETGIDDDPHYLFYVSTPQLVGDWRNDNLNVVTHADEACRSTREELEIECGDAWAMVVWREEEGQNPHWSIWTTRTGIAPDGRAVRDLAGNVMAPSVVTFLNEGPNESFESYEDHINWSFDTADVFIWTGMTYQQGVYGFAACESWTLAVEGSEVEGGGTSLVSSGPGWWGESSQACFVSAHFLCMCPVGE